MENRVLVYNLKHDTSPRSRAERTPRLSLHTMTPSQLILAHIGRLAHLNTRVRMVAKHGDSLLHNRQREGARTRAEEPIGHAAERNVDIRGDRL